LTIEAPTVTKTLEATPTRRATATRRPTLTPTITTTPEPRFVLYAQERRCDDDAGGALRITVLDTEGEPVPNVELLIRWDEGEDRFFTGLKPEKGVGYADYALAAGKSYQVGMIGLKSDFAQGIVSDACGDGTRASWDLVFRLQDGAG
jgi:hypothetical protein